MAPQPTLQTIVIDRISPGAVLFSYNQPKISNAFTLEQYHNLRDALVWARDEKDVRVVALTGKGKHYCAGKVLTPPGKGPTIEQEIEAGRGLADVLVGYPKVLIAAVNGAAIGWGCTQLFNFDLVYASQRAIFQTPFMSMAFVPEGASSYTFPKVMGKQHANRLLLAAEKLSAQEMYVSGLVTEVIPGEQAEFVDAVCEKAKRIGTFNAEALRMCKALVNKPTDIARQREASVLEGHDLKVRLNSDDAKAMVKAFLDRTGKSKSKL
ncbi:ClpP/crotonase [Rhizodiscina lignyota]|uniref:ClpP/crotonase n=1 Tax=Rhizodiscina lignyota TaxID=1504668 RepID=A0A9P4IP97_9PEZI|nr:ClpP/crotonase [Rhizodiscina lignyota]